MYDVRKSFKCLSHWGRDKITAILQTTFSNAFSWMKIYEFRSRFHWNLFLRFQLTISHHNGWAPIATSHYLNQWWLIYWQIYASLGLNELYIECSWKSRKTLIRIIQSVVRVIVYYKHLSVWAESPFLPPRPQLCQEFQIHYSENLLPHVYWPKSPRCLQMASRPRRRQAIAKNYADSNKS